jgi:hypothetical protein
MPGHRVFAIESERAAVLEAALVAAKPAIDEAAQPRPAPGLRHCRVLDDPDGVVALGGARCGARFALAGLTALTGTVALALDALVGKPATGTCSARGVLVLQGVIAVRHEALLSWKHPEVVPLPARIVA